MLRFSGLLVLYSLLRLIFPVGALGLLFRDIIRNAALSFFYGLRFDATAICILNTPFFFPCSPSRPLACTVLYEKILTSICHP